MSEVIFAIDASNGGERTDTAIIADITKDDAWITADVADAAQLDAWR